MLDILDGIIATGVVILALSLIVQAIQQIAKQVLDLKSAYMRNQLLALFGNPDPQRLSAWISSGGSRSEKQSGARGGEEKLEGSALTRLLAGGVRFIPDAMLPPLLREQSVEPEASQIVRELSAKIKSFGYKDLELIENADKEKFKEMIKSLKYFQGRNMQRRLKSVLREIDVWFELSMQAFQSHYVRRMKYWAIGISFAVVLLGNANLFEIYRDLATNKPVRDAAVAMGERLASLPRDSVLAGRFASLVDSNAAGGATADAGALGKTVGEIKTVLEQHTFQLWRWNRAVIDRLARTSAREWLVRILGWMSMTLLVSLGAPFWYDFLKAVMGVKERLRSTRDQSSESS